jgi:uncharacterized protein (AIM24 family)
MEAPRIEDLTRFQFSSSGSTCQVDGTLVPVAEINLAAGDSVYFERHVLLWKDEDTALTALPVSGGLKRTLGGMPLVVTVARGPGRVAFSRDAAGELVVLPLHPGAEIDVREHAFLVASHTLSYSFERIKGLTNLLHGEGMYLDRFVTSDQPGVLLLHGNGNVLARTLAPGEKIMTSPGGFLYKDSTVSLATVQQNVRTGPLSRGMYMAELTGPGRVGLQTMDARHPTS